MIIGSCVKDRVYVMLREGLSPVWLSTGVAHLPFNWYVVDWHTLSISDWPNYWDPLSCVCPSTEWLTRCGLALKTEWACNTRRISSKIKAEPTDNKRITLASRKVIRITTALHYHHSISPRPQCTYALMQSLLGWSSRCVMFRECHSGQWRLRNALWSAVISLESGTTINLLTRIKLALDRKHLIRFLFVLSIVSRCITTSDKSVAVLFLRTHARAMT